MSVERHSPRSDQPADARDLPEADRSGLASPARYWEEEANRLRERVGWHEVELNRITNSRSFRIAQRIGASLPAQLLRRALWMVKDRLRPVIRVRATGQRNPASSGHAVWMLEEENPTAVVGLDGHWRYNGTLRGASAWKADGQGTLVLTPREGSSRIRLRGHPAAGIAEVRYLGRSRRVDCYRPVDSVVEIDTVAGALGTTEPPAPGTIANPAFQVTGWAETLARFRASGQPHLALAPPDWLGVSTAMRTMFGHVLPVGELPDATDVEFVADTLAESGVRKIVLGGFAKGYEELVRHIRRRHPAIRVYATWHGNSAQHEETYCRWGFNTLHALAEEGLIACVGHTKVGLQRSIAHAGYPVRTLLNWYPIQAEFDAAPIDDGLRHLGLFTAGSGWRKNVLNQITAAALVERHGLHMKLNYPHEREWAHVVRANLVEVFDTYLSEEEFQRAFTRMHCNLYVTFSENGPLFPLESLGRGVVSVLGPAGHLFRDHRYLRDRLIVPFPDDPVVIADYVSRAIDDRDAILGAYREFCREYIPLAERSVAEFLAVE